MRAVLPALLLCACTAAIRPQPDTYVDSLREEYRAFLRAQSILVWYSAVEGRREAAVVGRAGLSGKAARGGGVRPGGRGEKMGARRDRRGAGAPPRRCTGAEIPPPLAHRPHCRALGGEAGRRVRRGRGWRDGDAGGARGSRLLSG